MIKTLFTLSFLAIFGTYGLGLAGILDDPKGLTQLDLTQLNLAKVDLAGTSPSHQKQELSKPDGHYTLKAMR